MRIKKSFLILFLISTTTIARSMDVEDNKLILVHASSIFTEDNIKTAGAQSILKEGTSFTEAENTNIRRRITLHHSLGGMVPPENHGIDETRSGHLDANKDMCAFLDVLDNFQGEIFGGIPHDFITIDKHTYGTSSLIITPQHRVKEFKEKNPRYTGRLVIFDPNQISLRAKVDEVIKEIPGAVPLQQIKEKNDEFIQFCKSHHYSHKEHASTPFMLFEDLTKPFHTTIDFINREVSVSSLLPANQVEPLSIFIEFVLEHIEHKLNPLLNKNIRESLNHWILDTKNWLSLFKKDAELRKNESKSFFINKHNTKYNILYEKDPEILSTFKLVFPTLEKTRQIIQNRHNATYLSQVMQELFRLDEIDLKEENKDLYKSVEKIHVLPSTSLKGLRNILVEKGYSAQAHELVLLHSLKRLHSSNKEKKSGLFKNEELIINLIENLTPSQPLRQRLQTAFSEELNQDTSFKNQNTISWLNSPAGKALRKKMWNDSSHVNFWSLLKTDPQTSLLFNDLDADYPAEKFTSSDKRFIDIVRTWMLEKCGYFEEKTQKKQKLVLQEPSFEPKNFRERLKSFTYSLYNYNEATDIIQALNFYRMALCKPLKSTNDLQNLINEGCFKSWLDLFDQLFDLRGLSKEEIKNILPKVLPGDSSVAFLGTQMEFYLKERQQDRELFENSICQYQEIAYNIATAGDETEPSLFGNSPLEWYIETLLPLCVEGTVKEIGENKAIIYPNWKRAKMLYFTLYQMASAEEKKRLDEIIKPTL